MLNDRRKGMTLAAASTVFASLLYILGHEALIRCSFPVFLFLWYSCASVAFSIYALRFARVRPWRVERKNLGGIAMYLLLEVGSAVMFLFALKLLAPTVASFVAQSALIFILVFGVLILKERFTGIEILGSALILSGILLISYSSDPITLTGVGLMLASNVTWAFSNVVTKKLVQVEDPRRLAFLRSLVFVLYGGIYILVSSENLVYPDRIGWIFIITGGLAGPFLSLITRYIALFYLELSKVALITDQYPILVILFTYLYTGELPEIRKILGGAIAIAGTMVFMTARHVRKTPAK